MNALARIGLGIASMVCLAAGLGGCDGLVPSAPPATPVTVFEDLWGGVDRYAGNLALRGIDWDSVRIATRPKIDPAMSDRALFDTLAAMLYTIRDPHVRLMAPFASFETLPDRAEANGWQRTFDEALVRERLGTTVKTAADGRVLWGWIGDPGAVGYLWLRDFKGGLDATWFDEVDPVLDALMDARAILLDLRDNDGGNGIRARDIAGRFAAEPRVFLRTQGRTGPGADDFSEPYEHVVRPTGAQPYRGPVVLLTSRFTVSAAERFVLAMQRATDVQIVGEPTAGSPGSTHERELVNGWLYSLSFERVTTASGASIEGVGIQPDHMQPTTPGRDDVLERALRLLE